MIVAVAVPPMLSSFLRHFLAAPGIPASFGASSHQKFGHVLAIWHGKGARVAIFRR